MGCFLILPTHAFCLFQESCSDMESEAGAAEAAGSLEAPEEGRSEWGAEAEAEGRSGAEAGSSTGWRIWA